MGTGRERSADVRAKVVGANGWIGRHAAGLAALGAGLAGGMAWAEPVSRATTQGPSLRLDPQPGVDRAARPSSTGSLVVRGMTRLDREALSTIAFGDAEDVER